MSGAEKRLVVYIAMDDTDHPEIGCTTYHFHQMLERISTRVEDFAVIERRLVRLWPFAPKRTRGNAALAAVCSLPEKNLRRLSESVEDFHHALLDEIESTYPVDEHSPQPTLILADQTLPEHWYWDSVRGFVDWRDRLAAANGSFISVHSTSTPIGIVGASSAIAWSPDADSTWELIAWRKAEAVGTERRVSSAAIVEMEREHPGTFANRDPTAGCGLIAPRTPCPVLYGIRGDSEAIVDAAHRFLQARDDVERSENHAVHRTNQVSDHHLLGSHVGTVLSAVEETQGGHASLVVYDGERIHRLVAFSESGPVNRLLRSFVIGDVVEWVGLPSPQDGAIHLERLRLVELVPRTATRPSCCDRSMRSAGSEQPLRCLTCGATHSKVWIVRPTHQHGDSNHQGWVEPTPSNRRHLAKPLDRGLPQLAKSQD